MNIYGSVKDRKLLDFLSCDATTSYMVKYIQEIYGKIIHNKYMNIYVMVYGHSTCCKLL